MASRLRLLPSCPFCSPSSSSSSSSTIRSFSTTLPTSTPPKKGFRSHLKKPPQIPNPLPQIYPQTVLLSDGSSFTSYTTAPSPQILRLTRDVTNNPLWNPLSEGRRGEGEEENGRLARFRARFGGGLGSDSGSASASAGGSKTGAKQSATNATNATNANSAGGAGASGGFGAGDLDWMSELAVAEKISAKDMASAAVKNKKKK